MLENSNPEHLDTEQQNIRLQFNQIYSSKYHEILRPQSILKSFLMDSINYLQNIQFKHYQ